ncbi:hypothetical protein [Helicobacter sp.]|uniref:hypothetical protein n=1 Tax=Helicobacter sp. TaxID=218 RepID=UPI0025BD433E|nr:hypothetical protein [Helicobacter sp.]MCI5968214.1 hypothetical protein [Helicobacter sp.]MDY2584910.1 hypothetical protein [Helicobacter sp.]
MQFVLFKRLSIVVESTLKRKIKEFVLEFRKVCKMRLGEFLSYFYTISLVL